MRSSAEVLPDCLAGLGIDVVVDGHLGATDLNVLVVVAGIAALEPDEFELERLGGELSAGFIVRHNTAHEALPLLDDTVHLFFEGGEVFRSERGVDLEVIVKTVRDRRADAQFCLGVDALNGLREYVRGRVTQNVETIGARDVDTFDDITGLRLVSKIAKFTVDTHRDNRLLTEQLEPGVRCGERDALGHDGLLWVTLPTSLVVRLCPPISLPNLAR